MLAVLAVETIPSVTHTEGSDASFFERAPDLGDSSDTQNPKMT